MTHFALAGFALALALPLGAPVRCSRASIRACARRASSNATSACRCWRAFPSMRRRASGAIEHMRVSRSSITADARRVRGVCTDLLDALGEGTMSPTDDKAVPDHVRAALSAAALDIAQRTSASRSIARIVEPHALTTRTLEERRLIHRDESARVQADAFREIRTRLARARRREQLRDDGRADQPRLGRQLRRAQPRDRVRVRRGEDGAADRLRRAPCRAA